MLSASCGNVYKKICLLLDLLSIRNLRNLSYKYIKNLLFWLESMTAFLFLSAAHHCNLEVKYDFIGKKIFIFLN